MSVTEVGRLHVVGCMDYAVIVAVPGSVLVGPLDSVLVEAAWDYSEETD